MPRRREASRHWPWIYGRRRRILVLGGGKHPDFLFSGNYLECGDTLGVGSPFTADRTGDDVTRFWREIGERLHIGVDFAAGDDILTVSFGRYSLIAVASDADVYIGPFGGLTEVGWTYQGVFHDVREYQNVYARRGDLATFVAGGGALWVGLQMLGSMTGQIGFGVDDLRGNALGPYAFLTTLLGDLDPIFLIGDDHGIATVSSSAQGDSGFSGILATDPTSGDPIHNLFYEPDPEARAWTGRGTLGPAQLISAPTNSDEVTLTVPRYREDAGTNHRWAAYYWIIDQPERVFQTDADTPIPWAPGFARYVRGLGTARVHITQDAPFLFWVNTMMYVNGTWYPLSAERAAAIGPMPMVGDPGISLSDPVFAFPIPAVTGGPMILAMVLVNTAADADQTVRFISQFQLFPPFAQPYYFVSAGPEAAGMDIDIDSFSTLVPPCQQIGVGFAYIPPPWEVAFGATGGLAPLLTCFDPWPYLATDQPAALYGRPPGGGGPVCVWGGPVEMSHLITLSQSFSTGPTVARTLGTIESHVEIVRRMLREAR